MRFGLILKLVWASLFGKIKTGFMGDVFCVPHLLLRSPYYEPLLWFMVNCITCTHINTHTHINDDTHAPIHTLYTQDNSIHPLENHQLSIQVMFEIL